MSTHHITMPLEKAISHVKGFENKGQQQYFFADDNGNYLPNEKCLKEFEEYKEKGYTYVPTCDNVDETGKCKGHSEEATA